MDPTAFLEIEHKYLVPDDWDLEAFEHRLQALNLKRHSRVQVTDRYFVTKACPGYIYRHRFDHELQHLTLKSLTGDPEVRLEVNLDLGHHCGNQEAAVKAFLSPMQILWTGSLSKYVRAYYFEDCEVVHYLAKFRERAVHCVEIEARKPATVAAGKSVLERYAHELKLEPNSRSQKSLFELLLLPHIPLGLISKHFD